MDTIGNHIDGTFNASASGTDVQTTDETITGTGVNSSLHQVVISDSDLNNIGNEINGDFDSWDNQINTTQVTQSGHNAGGSYWMSESLSDSPFIHKFGNSVDGTQEISQSGEENYTFTQTNHDSSDSYTLIGVGDNPYTLTGNDNANDGDSHRVKTGTDQYQLEERLHGTGVDYYTNLLGFDTYEQVTDSNSQSGAFTQTTTGDDSYSGDKILNGADTPVSDNTTYSTKEVANSRDADVVLTKTGKDRYDVLGNDILDLLGVKTFNNTSDGGNGTAGFADFSSVGLPIIAGRVSLPAGIMSGIGDDRYDYCFAGGTLILLGDHPPRPIEEMEEQLRVPAAPDSAPESTPALHHVLEVYRNAPAAIWHVQVAGQIIRTTANHPFYVRGKGWISAMRLSVGDQLRTHVGEWVGVEGVEDSGCVEPVFNLRVEGAHTYFVGTVADGPMVLVHNESDPSPNYGGQIGTTVTINGATYQWVANPADPNRPSLVRIDGKPNPIQVDPASGQGVKPGHVITITVDPPYEDSKQHYRDRWEGYKIGVSDDLHTLALVAKAAWDATFGNPGHSSAAQQQVADYNAQMEKGLNNALKVSSDTRTDEERDRDLAISYMGWWLIGIGKAGKKSKGIGTSAGAGESAEEAAAADAALQEAAQRLNNVLDLTPQEEAGGHTILKHVGQTDADLAARLAKEPKIPAASTFQTQAEAEEAIANVIAARKNEIASWVSAGAKGKIALDAPSPNGVGAVLKRGATASAPGTATRAVLKGDGAGGYFILTGFPLP